MDSESRQAPERPVERRRVAVTIADLFFASKVRALAGPLGVRVVVLSKPDRLIETVERENARLVIVDLETRSPGLFEILREFTARSDLSQIRLIGFASHVNAAAFEAAQNAGVGTALARSAFVRDLPAILSGV